MWEKVVGAAQGVITAQHRIQQLERNVEDLADEVDDIDRRLIRLEALVEYSGGGRPPPRRPRLPRS